MENSENKIENKKVSKAIKIIAVIFGVVAFLIIANYIYVKRQIAKGELVNYYGKWYTKEDLKKEFPPQYYDVPAKNTPEEVYAEFRQALLNNDIEKALGLIREENKEKYKEVFSRYADLKELREIYPEIIRKDKELGNFSFFSYSFIKNNKEINSSIEFRKDENGYWKIDNI